MDGVLDAEGGRRVRLAQEAAIEMCGFVEGAGKFPVGGEAEQAGLFPQRAIHFPVPGRGPAEVQEAVAGFRGAVRLRLVCAVEAEGVAQRRSEGEALVGLPAFRTEFVDAVRA